MNTKLFIGNLPWSATAEDLKSHFASAGTVNDAVVISDRVSGRSKGFGFVEMATPEEAEEAVKKFNGQNFQDRQIVVSEARPRAERPPAE